MPAAAIGVVLLSILPFFTDPMPLEEYPPIIEQVEAAITEEPILEPEERIEPTSRGTFRITAYCLRGIMRDGTYTRGGSIAIDPRVIPLGSDVTIEGLPGVYTARDTGGGVRGNWIDIWVPTYNEAINWGVQYREIYSE